MNCTAVLETKSIDLQIKVKRLTMSYIILEHIFVYYNLHGM